MSKILVTGASGHLGAAVAEHLLKSIKPSEIKVLTRDAGKVELLHFRGAEIAIGDYSDYKAMLAALNGIEKLYLVSGTDLSGRGKQQANVIAAAKESGVKHIVYSSFQRKNETETSPIAFIAAGHLSTEAELKKSGITYTILQHGLYSDIIPLFAGDKLMSTKTIYLPAGDTKVAFASRSDFAEAGANVLLEKSEKYNNKVLELGGSEKVSWVDIAEIISGVTGQKIVYQSPSVEEFTKTLSAAGVPAEYVGLFAGFSTAIKDGEFENTSLELEKLLGRKPVLVADYLKTVYGK